MQRNLAEFVGAAAAKLGVEPSKVVRTVRITQKGLHILMDDEAIRELPEGQDMKAEFAVSDAQQNQWNSRPRVMDSSTTYELRLIF